MSQVWAGFGYYSPVTVNSGQVPSTQTDFPVLISQTDARLKTVGNGGHVQDAEGDDIRPYTDSALTTAITGYEKVFYDGTNGILEMWVKRSSLADGNVTYLAYGDASLTADASSTTTWSNSFKAVYHLKDGTTLSLLDSSGHSYTLTNNNTATATTGQIDGAVSLVRTSSQYLDRGTGDMGTGTGGITLSVWVKATSFTGAYNSTLYMLGASGAVELLVKSNGKLAPYIDTSGGGLIYDGTGSHTLSTGTWYYLTMVYSNAVGLIGYVNGASDGTVAAAGNPFSFTSFDIGRDEVTSGRLWNGLIDEARVATTARSANWVTTEYNEGFPATFETLGAEVNLTAASKERSAVFEH